MPLGRRGKLTPELRDAIVKLVVAGNYPEVAAQANGINRVTYYRWMSRGRSDKEGPYCDFCNAIKDASAKGETANLAAIRKIAKGKTVIERRTVTKRDGTTEVVEKFSLPQWTAYAWIEERRYAIRWGKLEVQKIAELTAQVKELEKQIGARGTRKPDTETTAPGQSDG